MEKFLLEKVILPIKGLFKELVENHVTTGDSLLMAKLVEDEFRNIIHIDVST